eukprot:jgi/Mesen1/7440/ME000389S06782
MLPTYTKKGGRGKVTRPRISRTVCGRGSYLSLFLTVLVFANVYFFFGQGRLGPAIKAVSGGAHADAAQQHFLWTSDLAEAPDNLTCEAWLSRADSVILDRDFWEAPIRIRGAREARETEWGACPVGCLLAEDYQDAQCDGNVGAEKGPCLFPIIWQNASSHVLPARNNSLEVILSTSFESDVIIGQPSWHTYAFMAAVPPKDARAHAVAVLAEDCHNLDRRLRVVNSFRSEGVLVDTFGRCVGNQTFGGGGGREEEARQLAEVLGHYRFSIVFEDWAEQDYVTAGFWQSLAAGTVPVVISPTDFSKFAPAENAYMQVAKDEELRKTAEWMVFLHKDNAAYGETLRWKDDWPADTFMALMDMSAVSTECRLCTFLASQILQAREAEVQRPCRCYSDYWDLTFYHVHIRERGRFEFDSFFMTSDDLTASALIKKVYRLFREKRHEPVWREHRPDSVMGASVLRAFRIYPAIASQDAALQGYASFKTDEQVRVFMEATPCPKLEVIFL